MGVIQPATFLVVQPCLKSDGSTSACLHAYGHCLDTMATPLQGLPCLVGHWREWGENQNVMKKSGFFLCDSVTRVSPLTHSACTPACT